MLIKFIQTLVGCIGARRSAVVTWTSRFSIGGMKRGNENDKTLEVSVWIQNPRIYFLMFVIINIASKFLQYADKIVLNHKTEINLSIRTGVWFSARCLLYDLALILSVCQLSQESAHWFHYFVKRILCWQYFHYDSLWYPINECNAFQAFWNYCTLG